MKYCLWIVPPQPHLNEIHSKIEHLAKLNDSPSFMPHVTLKGGIELQLMDEKDYDSCAAALLKDLKNEFGSFSVNGNDGCSGIPCKFVRSKGFVSGYDKKGEIVWSQACVGIIERNEKLLEARDRAERCLSHSKYVISSTTSIEKNRGDFAPPLGEPHLSFIYKASAVQLMNMNNVDDDDNEKNEVKRTSDLELPQDFIANEIVLVKTQHLTVEGVPSWKTIGSLLI